MPFEEGVYRTEEGGQFINTTGGFSYMMSLGYDEVARICLTHSFNNMTTDVYIGRFEGMA